jgi:putative phosphoribosyl transferase
VTDSAAPDTVSIPVDAGVLQGSLTCPAGARALVLFAHGSGSSRHSPRNTHVAGVLHARGMATLLFDLLTPAEDVHYRTKFDIDLLTERLLVAAAWVKRQALLASLKLGYVGASTGAAAAIRAAALDASKPRAVVSRGGRPDLAGQESLRRLAAPTLLIVGGRDVSVLALNREAFASMQCEKRLSVVPGAGHLFEEPGTLDHVAQLAADWFAQHLMAND